jgi:putative hydrolase of the HAD superfamily
MGTVPLAATGPIVAVSFDAGGTLLAPWPSVGTVYAQFAARHGAPDLDAGLLDQRFAALWRQRHVGFAFTREGWQELVADAFVGIHVVGRDPRFFAELYEHYATAAPWRVFEDVAPTLTGLQRLGLRLAVTSNWDDRLPEVLRAIGLAEYFEVVTASGVAGVNKPAPALFRITADRLGVPPSAMLHVGDEVRADFDGARAAGCPAVVIARGPATSGQPAGAIGSLRELLPLIEPRQESRRARSRRD